MSRRLSFSLIWRKISGSGDGKLYVMATAEELALAAIMPDDDLLDEVLTTAPPLWVV